jgi:biotin synthase-like enzyme
MGFTQAEQALMFLAGANSIFYGEQLLTTSNPEVGYELDTVNNANSLFRLVKINNYLWNLVYKER